MYVHFNSVEWEIGWEDFGAEHGYETSVMGGGGVGMYLVPLSTFNLIITLIAAANPDTGGQRSLWGKLNYQRLFREKNPRWVGNDSLIYFCQSRS